MTSRSVLTLVLEFIHGKRSNWTPLFRSSRRNFPSQGQLSGRSNDRCTTFLIRICLPWVLFRKRIVPSSRLAQLILSFCASSRWSFGKSYQLFRGKICICWNDPGELGIARLFIFYAQARLAGMRLASLSTSFFQHRVVSMVLWDTAGAS